MSLFHKPFVLSFAHDPYICLFPLTIFFQLTLCKAIYSTKGRLMGYAPTEALCESDHELVAKMNQEKMHHVEKPHPQKTIDHCNSMTVTGSRRPLGHRYQAKSCVIISVQPHHFNSTQGCGFKSKYSLIN